ncbi:hypothetical protein [Pseudonocardia sp. KRD291]|uniref:hypothetical protein n=1 Tax=Pseudonocardia sp. KRD291 TaxID=2792007 RepID=UPI001C49FA12|nr:hypothetical protein [Pseudonocardia sp. KRD291]MBW0103978.1 hypothetical protein [Pseudonocardia sp. KRD291]
MTNPAQTRPSTRPGPHTPRVSVWQVLAAAWHQHRSTLLVSGVAVLVASAIVVVISRLDTAGEEAVSPTTVQLIILLVDLYPLGVGVFLAAPLLAREYEHQTHLFAWSQDVSPTRWLAGKTVLLLTVAIVSALLLGGVTRELVLTTPGTRDFAFDVPYFDASPLVQTGHVVFAFALGLAVGLLVKRSVLAMTLTFVGFLAARIVTAFWIRPHYLSPVHTVAPVGQGSGYGPGLAVDSGYLTSSGQSVALPANCATSSSGDYLGCLGRNDIASVYLDSQPIDRLLTFQLTETGIALAVAVVLAAVTWTALRRTTRG